jgi:lysophospholipase L1-like esterase
MTVNSSRSGRRAAGAIALTAALLAASCGGGQLVSRFQAGRVIAFGDESSVIIDTHNDANGSKFTVNATVSATDPTLACASNPIWVQTVAQLYGVVFPQCNPASSSVVVAPTGRIRASVGARAADLGAQIDAQQAESPLGASDLVTVLVGENDVIAEYLQYPAVSEPQLIANVEAEGAEAGRQVNRITDTGAKVLLATIIDVGVTPFGIAERNAHADTDRSALLTRLSARYNASLRATIVNDGRKIGLVLLDELVDALAKFPGLQGFTDVTDPVCDLTKSMLTPPSILDCTTLTLVPDGSGAFLWADDRHLSASAQNLFASSAIQRAQNNPF